MCGSSNRHPTEWAELFGDPLLAQVMKILLLELQEDFLEGVRRIVCRKAERSPQDTPNPSENR